MSILICISVLNIFLTENSLGLCKKNADREIKIKDDKILNKVNLGLNSINMTIIINERK